METVSSTSDERTVNNSGDVRFEYRVLNDAEKAAVLAVKTKGQEFIDLLKMQAPGREVSLAITNAQQSVMWAVAGLTA